MTSKEVFYCRILPYRQIPKTKRRRRMMMIKNAPLWLTSKKKSLLAEKLIKAWCHILKDLTTATKQNQHLRKRKLAY